MSCFNMGKHKLCSRQPHSRISRCLSEGVAAYIDVTGYSYTLAVIENLWCHLFFDSSFGTTALWLSRMICKIQNIFIVFIWKSIHGLFNVVESKRLVVDWNNNRHLSYFLAEIQDLRLGEPGIRLT